MGLLEYEKAIAYAIRRLETELDPILTYHSAAHTRDDVMHAIEELATADAVTGEDYILLRTAAAFHDLGYVEQRNGRDHEERSAAIAAHVLPDYGFDERQIEIIQGMIMATKVPQKPQTVLEALMVDADLDSLGRPDYFIVSNRLRQELAHFGVIQSDADWYQGQLDFLTTHQYFTDVARQLRDDGKAANLKTVREILSRITE
jgi:uncharacterized protein